MMTTHTADTAPGRRTFSANPAECRPELLLPEQLECARHLFETFLRGLASHYSADLLRPVTIRFDRVEQIRGVESAGEGITVLLDLAPFPGAARLRFGQAFLCIAVEALLGASETRESLTEVDLHVANGLIETAIAEMQRVWQSAGSSFRKVPARVLDTRPTETREVNSIVLIAEVRVGAAADTLQLILPSAFVRLISGVDAPLDTAREREALWDALGSAEFTVEAILRADLRIRDLLAFRPDMVLQLPHKSGAVVEGYVNGAPKFRGPLIQNGNSVGFQIEAWTGEDKPQDDSDR